MWERCPGRAVDQCVGTRGDGRIDISAAVAWPNRAPEPIPLSAEDVAKACALFAACFDAPPIGSLAEIDYKYLDISDGAMRYQILRYCVTGGFGRGLATYSDEQRVIPLDNYDERWSFLLRAVLAASGDCGAIRGILTPATTARSCEEDGCWNKGSPSSISCEGEVAIFANGGRRDCSRSYTTCSPESNTGCTDRLLMGCHVDALDRCDGNIKLGCDHCGYVTFRDCAYGGGRCVEDVDGAHCEPSGDAGVCSGGTEEMWPTPMPECAGSRLQLCVFGSAVEVDCTSFGAQCCTSSSWERPEGGLNLFKTDAGDGVCGPRVNAADLADANQASFSYCAIP